MFNFSTIASAVSCGNSISFHSVTWCGFLGPNSWTGRDEKTLLIPDRRGNNKIDSLRNIIADPRVALLFLIPGTGTILRVNGRACISAEAQLCQSFAVNAALPKSVLIVTVEAAFFQCARALLRSRLWEMDARVAPDAIPSTGDVLSYFSGKAEEGKAFDEAATARMRGTLW